MKVKLLNIFKKYIFKWFSTFCPWKNEISCWDWST